MPGPAGGKPPAGFRQAEVRVDATVGPIAGGGARREAADPE
jgi:hypothetical protein